LKGKIPRSEWQTIIARHEKGEALSQIAGDYGCSAPAISYILKRTKDMQGGQTVVQTTGEETATAPAIEFGKVARMATREGASLPKAPPAVPEGEASQPWFSRDTQHEIGHHVASFVVALDCLLADGSAESIDAMLAASEQLMQVAARTRIEATRLRETTAASVEDRVRRRS
jgi:hypothetical protein